MHHAIYRALVTYSNSTTGEIRIKIPSLIGIDSEVSISYIGREIKGTVWSVPTIGDQIVVAADDENLTNIFWVQVDESVGTGTGGGGDAYVGSTNTFTTNQVIEGTTTTALLRLTQLGTGNALLVEDSTNVDATPFVISSAGFVGVGMTTPTVKLDVLGSTTIGTQNNVAAAFGTTTSGRLLIGSVTGNTPFIGSEGAANLHFTTDGTSRMSINSTGQVGIGVTPSTTIRLSVFGGSTASANPALALYGVSGSGTLSLFNDTGAGSYNSIVPANGKAIIAIGANATTSKAALVIATWSNVSYGIKLEGGSTTNILINGTTTATPSAAADKAFIVKGVAAQTGNLQDWQDSAGSVLAHVTSAGAAKFTSINGGTP